MVKNIKLPPGNAKFFMIQGTTSSAGKSALTTGFLRYFSAEGRNSSPFKSQNMSLNSFVTGDGFEIAVSQAIQSEAAFKTPIRQINPILIKPSSDYNMHLIVDGKFYGNMNFKEYNKKKDYFLKKAKASFDFLTQNNDLIILEGAGSPAEINLFKFDIVNMGFAELYDIPVILVADIERGGVFASIFGTVKLLPLKWRRLIKGFIINKFRGDIDVLRPGIKSIESMLKIPCFGVLPYIKNLRLEAEDSLDLKERPTGAGAGKIRVGIVQLDRISNFNEFDPLFFDSRIDARFFKKVPESIAAFDIVIIPGSKSTIGDILSLKKNGIFDYINDFGQFGIILGICGGFQMMGKFINDPFHIESEAAQSAGFGFFDTVTTINEEKRLLNRQYRFNIGKNMRTGGILNGYEIHNGRTEFYEAHTGKDVISGIFEPLDGLDNRFTAENGIASPDRKKIGTYIHGLFANDSFKDFIIDIASENLNIEKETSGRTASDGNAETGGRSNEDGVKSKTVLYNSSYDGFKNRNYDLLSENIGKYINVDFIKKNIGI